MCPDFSSYNTEWITRGPKWRDYYLSHDQTASYDYMKTGLKSCSGTGPRTAGC